MSVTHTRGNVYIVLRVHCEALQIMSAQDMAEIRNIVAIVVDLHVEIHPFKFVSLSLGHTES